MTQISAAGLLTIDFTPDGWHLIRKDEFGERTTLISAIPMQPLQYDAGFAQTRRLPKSGALPVKYVRQVVVGWSEDDQAWHLGILLMRDLADARGSRWCELADWPDPDQSLFRDHAHASGTALARILGRPFNFITPRAETESQPISTPKPQAISQPQQPSAPPPPLPSLPLHIGLWALENGDEQPNLLQFTRSRRWTIARMTRILWYVILGVLYVVLSVTTLNSDLALPNAGTMLPNPELLPYLGIIIAGFLTFLIVQIVLEIIQTPNRIVIDPNSRSIIGLRGNAVRWTRPAQELQSIYITQEVNKGRKKKRTIFRGEINLFLDNGEFQRILEQPDEEDTFIEDENTPAPTEEVIPLTQYNARSDIQVAGLYMAKTLGNLPCWYDQRLN